MPLHAPRRRAEGANGEVVLRLESGSPDVTGTRWPSAMYVGASWDPYELIDRGVAAAAAMSGGARPRSTKQVCRYPQLAGTHSIRPAFGRYRSCVSRLL